MENNRYVTYVNHSLKEDLHDLIDRCFSHKYDAEVIWKTFREQLKYIKKEHVEEYLKHLETDAED